MFEPEEEVKQVNDHRKKVANRMSPLKKVPVVTETGEIGYTLTNVDKTTLNKTAKYDIFEQKVFVEEEINRKRVF